MNLFCVLCSCKVIVLRRNNGGIDVVCWGMKRVSVGSKVRIEEGKNSFSGGGILINRRMDIII